MIILLLCILIIYFICFFCVFYCHLTKKMEDLKVNKIPRLNGDNYHAWSIRARACLVQKRCWEAIEPGFGPEMNQAETQKNEQALTLLFLIVDDTFLDDIGDCKRAEDAWNILKKMHTEYGLLHTLQLMREFFNINKKESETIKEYLGRLIDIHRKLTAGGYAFEDREVALVMLMGLPKSYEQLILSLEKEEQQLTTTIVKAKLIVEEKRILRNAEGETQECALTSKGTVKKYSHSLNAKPKWSNKQQNHSEKSVTNKQQNNPERRVRCFSCGEWGHISKFCTEEAKNKNKSAQIVMEEEVHHAFTCTINSSSRKWFLDSGATDHMTSQKDKFISFAPTSSQG